MTSAEPDRGEVIVYREGRGRARIEVRLAGESVWLSLSQMAQLFGRDKSVISRHLANVFRAGELVRKSVVAESATTAADGKTYQVEYYSLDAILSVGYRVNSKRGTQFRIWATQTLREHLLRGYTLAERRLREKGLGEMEQAVSLLAKTLTQHALVTDEGRAVLSVVQGYTRAWRWLLEYDEGRLAEKPARPKTPRARITAAPWSRLTSRALQGGGLKPSSCRISRSCLTTGGSSSAITVQTTSSRITS